MHLSRGGRATSPGTLAAVSTVLCLSALAACSGAPDGGAALAPSEAPTPADRSSLAPLTAPPKAVPNVELRSRRVHQSGSPLAHHWVTRTGRVVDAAPREPVAWPHPVDQLDVSAAIVVFDTTVLPVRVEFRSYDSVERRTGVPTTNSDPRECETQSVDGPACVVQVQHDVVVVTVPPDVARYVVLYAEWYVPAAQRTDRNISTYTASWGFRLR